VKKITAILLIACLAFCAAGYHFVFHFQVWQAKSEMKLRLLHSAKLKEITELSFTPEEQQRLKWEDDHELSFNGEMYDVIDQYLKNGKLVLRCIDDRKETGLIEAYLRFHKNNNDNRPLSAMMQLMSAQFIVPSTILAEPSTRSLNNSFGIYSSTIASVTTSIHTPPPRVC
jgi:hypothetical protein